MLLKFSFTFCTFTNLICLPLQLPLRWVRERQNQAFETHGLFCTFYLSLLMTTVAYWPLPQILSWSESAKLPWLWWRKGVWQQLEMALKVLLRPDLYLNCLIYAFGSRLCAMCLSQRWRSNHNTWISWDLSAWFLSWCCFDVFSMLPISSSCFIAPIPGMSYPFAIAGLGLL